MAYYLDLFSEGVNNSDLQDKVKFAVIVAAHTVVNEDVGTTNHANRFAWALEALRAPSEQAKIALRYMLAENKTLSIANIQIASDTAIQVNVDAAIDVMAGV